MPDPAAPIERFDVPVSGGTLAAYRIGGASGDAPTVVAVHGITATSRAWPVVARALRGRATLVAPDLRGRGRSNGLPGPFTIRALADDVLAVLDRLGIERAVLAGHSLGAYVIARLAADAPQRVRALVLVDGGLPIPGSEGVDLQDFVAAFLGPAVARLHMTFESREAYRAWWRAHPALADGSVADADLDAYADHDLTGEAPALRSSVIEECVLDPANDLLGVGETARRLAVPATLLCAERGLLDEPNPMQPLEAAQSWAAEDPARRRAVFLPGLNHYTITLAERGASAVAEQIAAALDGPA